MIVGWATAASKRVASMPKSSLRGSTSAGRLPNHLTCWSKSSVSSPAATTARRKSPMAVRLGAVRVPNGRPTR